MEQRKNTVNVLYWKFEELIKIKSGHTNITDRWTDRQGYVG